MRSGTIGALGAQPGRIRYSRRDTPVLGTIVSTQTWNNSNSQFRGFTLNATDIASSTTSLLIDLQVGSVSKFSVRKDGFTKTQALVVTGIADIGNSITGVGISPNGKLAWSNTNGDPGATTDTAITRVSAGLLSLGSGGVGDFTGSLKLTNLTSVGTITLGSFTTATSPVGTGGALFYDTTVESVKVYSPTLSTWGTIVSSPDSSIQKIQSITQAAYNALSPPSATTFYIISDAPSSTANVAQIANKTADYTITTSDYCINSIATIPINITLPSAIGTAGYIFVIKNSGTSSVTVSAAAGELIDGQASWIISTKYNSMTIQSLGASPLAWVIQ